MGDSTSSIDRLMEADLVREVEFLNARARSIGTFVANRHLAEHGLRVRSYSVLALACGGLAPTQRDLAEFLRLDPSQIVSLVDQLEGDGLVERETDPTDRRSKIVVATPAGEKLRLAAARAARAGEDEALAPLTPDEREQLRALLHKVAFARVSDDDAT